MTYLERAFDETKHVRGTGEQGGQFVAKGTGAAGKGPAARPRAGKGKPKGAGNLSFDGRRGTGYGTPGGDKRVKALQEALNRLGLTDGAGKKLAVDGKLGPRTTAAIKKAQRKLGLKADGVVTPALLRQLTTAKSLKKGPPAKKSAPAKAAPKRESGGGRAAPRAGGRAGGSRADKRREAVKAARKKVAKKVTPRAKNAPARVAVRYSERMTDDAQRHYPGRHNQGSHGNRLGRPTNVAGKTGLAKATAALEGKPEQGPLPAPAARALDGGASERKAAVEEYANLTRKDFEELPEERKAVILEELKNVAKNGEYDQATGRGAYGTRYRGQAEHVFQAKTLRSRFLAKYEPAPDNSVSGRAVRIKAAKTAGEVRDALFKATTADMAAIARENGWPTGGNSGWKKDRWIAFLIEKATEGKG